MNKIKSKSVAHIFLIVCVLVSGFALLVETTRAQNVKRVVIVKVDGLPGDYVDRYVKTRDSKTGKSRLPWFEEIFYKNGTRLANFYSRGMSLSATSWSLLDTGQHLQIKGNVEYDRLTFRSYDYLNFIPYYVKYGMKKRVDMPGVEVLDQLKVPLLSDAFPYEKRYASFQLFQRGADWGVLANGFLNLFPTNPRSFADEWTIGFDFLNTTVEQNERDIIKKLQTRPDIDYFDYYTTDFDHISHLGNNENVRFDALQKLDRTLGRFWTAIKNSSRGDETALVIVSDHGFNGEEKTYSQSFNLVRLLTSAAGGGHHVVTKRRLMLDYAIKGVNPFVPLITTESKESFYLKNQSGNYPTVMLDFDGNERASLQLRNNDLNQLHILWQEMQNGKLSSAMRKAASDAFFGIINRRRADWQETVGELTEELNILQRQIETRQKIIRDQPKKFTPEDTARGIDKNARRIAAQTEIDVENVAAYREYLRVLSNLLALKPGDLNAKNLKIEDYIAKGAMGERNGIYDLQNYVVGLSDDGLKLNPNGAIDFESSFRRIDYFELLQKQAVNSSVQENVGNSPVDFIAAEIPLDATARALPENLKPDENPIWLYGGADKQALILTRKNESGGLEFRYLPLANLRQNKNGAFSYSLKEWSGGFPLKMFEDADLRTANSDAKTWLNDWHTESEWFRATHKTIYSAAVINLREQFAEHPLTGLADGGAEKLSPDEKLIRRFRIRQRRLTETDLLILANNHWNFDVRGFNSGGNHGSFFRVSSNSTLMFAGGAKTNIPRGLTIEEPYDSLSFVPTVFALTGKINETGEPVSALYNLGFRKFPGRIIRYDGNGFRTAKK